MHVDLTPRAATRRTAVRMRRLALIACGLWMGALAQVAAQADVPLDTLLQRLGDYVQRYERDTAAVVSEEQYWQHMDAADRLTPAERLVLKSDVLMAYAGDLGWVAFRDVFEADGAAVRDRDDRLTQLFLHPAADSRTQVERIAEASSRFNLGWVRRTINIPTMVLAFASPREQHRSQFRRGGTVRIAGIDAREVSFRERDMPRLIHTPDAAPATGRFWIDPESGRVLRTELQMLTGPTTAVITVDYEEQPDLKLWLPVRMSERYSAYRRPAITGSATYQKFRRYQIAVDSVIK